MLTAYDASLFALDHIKGVSRQHAAGPLVLLAELAGLAGIALVHEIGTRSGAGGLVASAIRPGPGAIAPDPVAVATDTGRQLADGRTVRLGVVVGGHRRASERRRGEQRESRCQ